MLFLILLSCHLIGAASAARALFTARSSQGAMAWVMAWIGHKPPPTETPGIMYMLEGGTDASNTDPYAEKPTAGGDWIHTGPHMMVVGSASILKGYPSGPNPNTAAPYVMWAGTPYAHLMVPVK